MNRNEQFSRSDQEYYLPTFKRFPLAFERGFGSKLYDVDGKEYIDLLAGIAVCNVGHCHPTVVEAVRKQAGELMHISNFFVSPPQVNLSRKLVEISQLDRVFLTNSGAESVEGAIKIARKYASTKGRGGHVISMENSFHGRTLATIATGQEKYQKGFAPIPAGFSQVPFNNIDALKNAISKDVAAIILEPIQGEGGVRPAETEYLQAVRQLCNEHDVLLILDEVQCGVGRTGKWFAHQHYGIKPDIMTLAKGLGGGFPVGAILCSERVSNAIDFGDHGTTFGGNPLACAAALATISVIEKENLCKRAAEKGKELMAAFESRKERFPELHFVRGKGLMIGVVMKNEAAPLVKKLLEHGVVANATAGNVLRLVPPLNIPDEDLTAALSAIDQCLLKLQSTHA